MPHDCVCHRLRHRRAVVRGVVGGMSLRASDVLTAAAALLLLTAMGYWLGWGLARALGYV